MDLGLETTGVILVSLAGMAVVLVLLSVFTRWILRINHIVWLLARIAGVPEEVVRRKTLAGMIREAQRAGPGGVPEGAARGRTPAEEIPGLFSPQPPRSAASAGPEGREKTAPAGPQIAGREIAFLDRVVNAGGQEFKVVGSVSNGLLVETQDGSRDIIEPVNPYDPRKDWIYPVKKINREPF
jgi:hypothetical protein